MAGPATANSGAPPAAPPRPAALLFDMDGLLLDTESIYTVAQQAVLDEWGLKFTMELKAGWGVPGRARDGGQPGASHPPTQSNLSHPPFRLQAKMMGQKAMDAAQTAVSELGLGAHGIDAAEFLRRREAVLADLFPGCAIMPGAERLVRHAVAAGVPCAVATSSHTANFRLKTARHSGLFSLFAHVVTGDQVAAGKPAPDIFLECASRFDPAPPPADCLVFEDAPAGVDAAVAAGMRVVFVPDPAVPDGGAGGRATAVLASLLDFRPEEYGLPPYTEGGGDGRAE